MDLVTNETSHTLKFGTMQDATLKTDSLLKVAVAEMHTGEITALKSDFVLVFNSLTSCVRKEPVRDTLKRNGVGPFIMVLALQGA